MSELNKCLLQISDSTREAALGFGAEVEKYLSGQLDASGLKGYRAAMGVYEHREEGIFMTRIRFGAGIILPLQLRGICDLSDKYGNKKLHVTTRQDIQIHGITTSDTPEIQKQLLDLNLAARGGGGNTVRNIGVSARAGVDSYEIFDVRPYAIAANEYLLQFNDSYALPRKYKVAFAHSQKDDAFASVADLGFFAQLKEGKKGFSAYAGGGLGNKPAAGVLIEDWVDAEDCLLVCEAVRQVFAKHGDRENRHKARLRFVLDRLGKEEFVKIYREEKVNILKKGLAGEVPEFRSFPSPYEGRHGEICSLDLPGCIIPEKIAGFYTVRLNLPLGDISTEIAREVADLSEEYGEGLVRISQSQDMLICAVSGDNVEAVTTRLKNLSPELPGGERAEIVACTGAATCQLGICRSQGLSEAIDRQLSEDGVRVNPREVKIRISGCPNSCGNHPVAEIGLEGRAKKASGKLMPFYELVVGGKLLPGNVTFGKRMGSVPAKNVPPLISKLLQDLPFEESKIAKMIEEFSSLPDPVSEDYYIDWSDDKPLALK
ncbi:MAG: nitrite/sulfite reductase [Planctomycetota bacterium]|jgi:sulfite reductase (ferredoxin)